MVRQACQDDHPKMHEIVEDNVSQIEVQVGRLRGIASEFSLLGRSDLPEQEPLPLAGILEQIRAQYPSADGSLEIETRLDDADLTAFGSREALLKVLSNLVENAIQAMGGRGKVEITAAGEGDRVLIRVEDSGPGIPAEVEDRLFQPYFSTKSTGTGLGLVICRNLMEKMGGSVHLENRPEGAGARAILQLSAASGRVRNDS
jgi:signal transduction histidine kinase